MSELFDGILRPVDVNTRHPERHVEKYLDGTESQRLLRFKAHCALRSGLLDTIRWYERNFGAINPHEVGTSMATPTHESSLPSPDHALMV
jgi:hypothetical protein